MTDQKLSEYLKSKFFVGRVDPDASIPEQDIWRAIPEHSVALVHEQALALEAKLEAMERAERHMTLLDLVRAKCQYSLLSKFNLRRRPLQSEWRADIARTIRETARDWHMKPGAVYLGLEDYIFVSLCISDGVVVGVGSGIPEGHFLLTDGQELE